MNQRYLSRGLFCVIALLGAATWASAGTVTIDFSDGFSPDLGGGPTVLRATFADMGTNNVELKLEDVSMNSAEFVGDSGFYFNLNPLLDPTTAKLSITTTGSGAGHQAPDHIVQGVNGSKADGVDGFDIEIDYGNANSGGDRFAAGEFTVLTLQGINGQTISASDFNFGNENAKSFLAAAHLQGIPGDTRFNTTQDSVWLGPGVVVPLPATFWMGLALMGSCGLVGLLRRRQQFA